MLESPEFSAGEAGLGRSRVWRRGKRKSPANRAKRWWVVSLDPSIGGNYQYIIAEVVDGSAF